VRGRNARCALERCLRKLPLPLPARGVGSTFQSAFARRPARNRDNVTRVAASSDRVIPTERACALSGGHPLLEVVEVRDAGRVRVRLRGDLDVASAPTVTAALQRLREQGEHVLLDLDAVGFIDMSGLRVVIAAARDGSRDGWSFRITRGSPQVRRLISLVELDGQLPVDGSSE